MGTNCSWRKRSAAACVLAIAVGACGKKPAAGAEAAPSPGEVVVAMPVVDGAGSAPSGEPAAPSEPLPPPANATGGGTGAPSGFEQFYSYVPPVYRAAGQPPALPIALETLRADQAFTSGALPQLGVDDAAAAALSQRAFVVVASNPGFATDDLGEAFQALRSSEVPIYVSVDAALHLVHLIFDGLLMKLETGQLAPLLGRLLDALRAKALEGTGATGLVGQAALGNLAVLDTARRLLDPSAAVDERVRGDVEAEVALVDGRAGPADSPVFGYEEDYTQYVPRGHYTRSELLGRYFRSMMWLGRMAFLARAKEDPEPAGLVPLEAARRFAAQSLLLIQWMREAQVDGTAALHAWSRIYRSTAFFAGFADDVTPTEVAAAAERALGEIWSPAMLEDPRKADLFRLHIQAARVPRLYAGIGGKDVQVPPEAPPGLEVREKVVMVGSGLRLFGQRYTPDADVMARLSYPEVTRHTGQGTPFTLVDGQAGPVRGFARGLDLMGFLGAPTARAHVTALGDDAYEGFPAALEDAGRVFPAAGDGRWRSNLYWAWLDVLREVVAPQAPSTQAFQTTGGWNDRLLAGALASWATLRHDTILYVKQPYVPLGGARQAEPPPGFVDPYPEVFARLQALTRMTRKALRDMRLVEDGSEGAQILDEFDGLFARLTAIAVAELEDRSISEDDRGFLTGFAGWCGRTLDRLARLVGGPAAPAGETKVDLRTTLVADVQTNMDAQEALEEGVGKLDLLVAAVRVPGAADLFVAAGPVLSYYEFRRPVAERLTDEAWRALLAGADAPPSPSWTCSYRVPCPPQP